jgi:hypothetical protein
VKDAIIIIVLVLVVIAGFWWTRGYGGPAGDADDPSQKALLDLTALPPEHEDREHEVE